MPPILLSCESVSKAYTSRPLFEHLTFAVFEGDHVGLVGPNGAGKSTLLKILAGLEASDDGTRALRRGVRVGYVPQDPIFTPGTSVEDVLLDAIARDPVMMATVDEHERSPRVVRALGKSGCTDPTIATETLHGG